MRALFALASLALLFVTPLGPAAPAQAAVVEQWGLHNYNQAGSVEHRFSWDVPDGCTPMMGDWNGNTTDTVGVACVNGPEWAWALNNRHASSDPGGFLFGWGYSGCLPTVGDWDGNGSDTPGTVCISGAEWQWSLHNYNQPGGVEYRFGWGGTEGCWPITGDWNGDRRDTPGLVCPESDGVWRWVLHDYNQAGGVEYQFRWGSTTCGPIMGDWDGNGSDTPGTVCANGGEWQWKLHNYNQAGAVEYNFGWGSTSQRPIVGDWDGNRTVTPGTTTLGAQPPASGAYACPVSGSVSFSNDFGAPRSGGRTHQGIDMFASAGTPTVAAVNGVTFQVENVDDDLGGISLWIAGDDGHTYYYAHHRSNAVRSNGVRVSRGQVVGYVGNTGNAATTPSHLHFEWHPGGGVAANPYTLLRQWCG